MNGKLLYIKVKLIIILQSTQMLFVWLRHWTRREKICKYLSAKSKSDRGESYQKR